MNSFVHVKNYCFLIKMCKYIPKHCFNLGMMNSNSQSDGNYLDGNFLDATCDCTIHPLAGLQHTWTNKLPCENHCLKLFLVFKSGQVTFICKNPDTVLAS